MTKIAIMASPYKDSLEDFLYFLVEKLKNTSAPTGASKAIQVELENDSFDIYYFQSQCRFEYVAEFLHETPFSSANILIVGNFNHAEVVDLCVMIPRLRAVLTHRNPMLVEALGQAVRNDYLSPKEGHLRFSYVWRRSGEIDEHFEEIGRFARHSELFAGFRDIFLTTIKELVSNAFYNAPYDKLKNDFLFKNVARSKDVILPDQKSVMLKVYESHSKISLYVEDPFGSLKMEVFLENLLRASRRGDQQIRKNTSGSGVGLYTAFFTSNLFQINISSDHYTGMECLFYKTKRQRKYEEYGPNLIIRFK